MKKAECQMQNMWTALIYGAWHSKDDFLSFFYVFTFHVLLTYSWFIMLALNVQLVIWQPNTLKSHHNKSSNQLSPYKIVIAALLTIFIMSCIMC